MPSLAVAGAVEMGTRTRASSPKYWSVDEIASLDSESVAVLETIRGLL